MTTLKCADLGMTCDFVATAETKEETKAAMQSHLTQAHTDMAEDQKTTANTKIDELLNAEQAPAQTEAETPAQETVTEEAASEETA